MMTSKELKHMGREGLLELLIQLTSEVNQLRELLSQKEQEIAVQEAGTSAVPDWNELLSRLDQLRDSNTELRHLLAGDITKRNGCS